MEREGGSKGREQETDSRGVVMREESVGDP